MPLVLIRSLTGYPFISLVESTASNKNIAMQGNYGYCTSNAHTVGGSEALFIVDFTDPANAYLLSTLNSGDNFNGIRGVDVQGNLAFICAQYSRWLTVIDVTNKTAPFVRGSVQGFQVDNPAPTVHTMTQPYHVVADPDSPYVFVRDLSNQIVSVNVANPDAPTIAYVVRDPVLLQVAGDPLFPQPSISNGYLFVGYGTFGSPNSGGLTILSLANPALPVIVGSINLGAPCNQVIVEGNYAYVARNTPGGVGSIAVVDVTSKSAPSLVSDLPTDVKTAYTVSLAKSGRWVYVPSSGFITVIDALDPSSMKIKQFSDITNQSTSGGHCSVHVKGEFLILAKFAQFDEGMGIYSGVIASVNQPPLLRQRQQGT